MPKIYSYILLFITLITLSTCSSVLSVQSPPSVSDQEFNMLSPSTEIPLPQIDILLPPTPELGKTERPTDHKAHSYNDR